MVANFLYIRDANSMYLMDTSFHVHSHLESQRSKCLHNVERALCIHHTQTSEPVFVHKLDRNEGGRKRKISNTAFKTNTMSQPRLSHPWTLIEELDVGGTENDGIYLVKNELTRQICILKCFIKLPGAIGETEDGDTCSHELDTLSRLIHSNITRVVEYFRPELNDSHDSEDGCDIRSLSYNLNDSGISMVVGSEEEVTSGIFMEYCDGGTLAELIKKHRRDKQPIQEVFLWHVLESLASAIDYCHNGPVDSTTKWEWVIHFDVKPENCFLSSKMQIGTPLSSPHHRVVLGDFGCSITEQQYIDEGFEDRAVAEFFARQDSDFEPPEARCVHKGNDIY